MQWQESCSIIAELVNLKRYGVITSAKILAHDIENADALRWN